MITGILVAAWLICGLVAFGMTWREAGPPPSLGHWLSPLLGPFFLIVVLWDTDPPFGT